MATLSDLAMTFLSRKGVVCSHSKADGDYVINGREFSAEQLVALAQSCGADWQVFLKDHQKTRTAQSG